MVAQNRGRATIEAPATGQATVRAKARMGIPVFHDDQHGTAIIVSAAVTNALELAGKRLDKVKIVCSGAGAAGTGGATAGKHGSCGTSGQGALLGAA